VPNRGRDLTVEDVFNVGIPFEEPIDVGYFLELQNADATRQALRFLSNQINEFELRKRHTHADIVKLWKGVFRACIAHDVEIPRGLKGYANRLGVVPE
jgi:hypothetical protein